MVKDDIAIDKYHLDDESKNLPSVIGKCHDEVNRLTVELIDLEGRLEMEEATARKDVRAMFAAQGVKPTVDMVADEVSCMQSIAGLRRDVARRKTEISYVRGVLSALDAKRSCLGNLVSLYCRDYYTEKEDGKYREADVKHRMCDEYEDMAAGQERSLRDAMRRK